ncbi:MAG: alpha/beta family hydrolase [Kofleriaceae bacterium]|nr:alpha/beta family hydrolase [Kofleriaceae bacterium]
MLEPIESAALESVPVVVHAARTALRGDLVIPPNARGFIAFVHGSGSSRRSPRNQYVASSLARAGFATLLFDLLTVQEETAERYTRHLRFDIPLLATRMSGALRWVATRHELAGLPVGLFGASTGAAAALLAAADEPAVRAVVSRGGRPDLAAEGLRDVTCPTLFIVGSQDRDVLELNRRAMRLLACPARLEVVAGATHLFEEPGALDEVTRLAAAWFREYLGQPLQPLEMR